MELRRFEEEDYAALMEHGFPPCCLDLINWDLDLINWDPINWYDKIVIQSEIQSELDQRS